MPPAIATVSIVLPTCKGERFLSRALGSLFAQTFTDWELIVVDDCSTDGTAAILASVADPRVRVVRSDRRLGVPAALNWGFEMAVGAYHTWTSDDNLHEPDALEAMVAQLEERRDADVVSADFYVIDAHDAIQRRREVGSPYALPSKNEIGPCFLYRAELFARMGGFRESAFLVEDWDFWLRAYLSGARFHRVARPLYRYRDHVEGNSWARLPECYLASCRMLEELVLSSNRCNARAQSEACFALAWHAARARRPAEALHWWFQSLRRLPARFFWPSHWALVLPLFLGPEFRARLRPAKRFLERVAGAHAHGRIFSRLYRENAWGSWESHSGEGSELSNTAVLRARLPELLRELGVASLLDAPCGDHHWMSQTELGNLAYCGVDVVPELIAANRRRYPGRKFLVRDLTRNRLPRADLIFCRDCLVHFSDDDIRRALHNFKRSGARYLLTTTFVRHESNDPIETGEWRALNLERAPFGWPAPVRVIDEGYERQGPGFSDKSLGLWELRSL